MQIEGLGLSEGENGAYKEIISRVAGFGVYSQLKFEAGRGFAPDGTQKTPKGRVGGSKCGA